MPPTKATASLARYPNPAEGPPRAVQRRDLDPLPACVAAPSRSPLHARLRDETSELHHALEHRLALLDPDLELHRYNALLHAMYGYYAALEPKLARLFASIPAPTFGLQARAPRIEGDLLSLGWHPNQVRDIERCDMLPNVARVEHLAGCLYVLEGAALGGRVIAKVLDQRLGLSSERGCAFFAGDGHGVAVRWRHVLSWLEALPASGCHIDDIVESARDTFWTLTRWLEVRGALQ